MNQSQQFIQIIANASPPHRYNIGQYLLDCGRSWRVGEGSFKCKRGQMGECFRNAALMALGDPDLEYVEGYAFGTVVPVHHAWVVNRKDEVLDPTWPDGSDYFGVIISPTMLRKMMAETRMYGVLTWPSYKTYFDLMRKK